jgi:hypothetical protein
MYNRYTMILGPWMPKVTETNHHMVQVLPPLPAHSLLIHIHVHETTQRKYISKEENWGI